MERFEVKCRKCREKYEVIKARLKTTKYCSYSCKNKGSIKSEETKRKMREGHNKNSLNTEFKKGNKPWNYIDGRSSSRDRLYAYQVHKIWCEANKVHRIPKGCLIHHLDGNPMNNNSMNLIMLDKSTHDNLHNEIIKMIKYHQEVNLCQDYK